MSNLNLNSITNLDTGREVDVNRVMQTVDYVGGLVIDSLDTVIVDGDDRYVLASSTALPYTTTGAGMPEGDAFVSVGDTVLRKELADPDKGGLMVRGAVIYVDTIADLQALPTSDLVDEQQVSVLSYHAPLYPSRRFHGGGTFKWRSQQSKSEHNGGTVIDPLVSFPVNWDSDTARAAWFVAINSGNGCFERVPDSDDIFAAWFGTKGDKTTDDTYSIQAALDYAGEEDDGSLAFIRDGSGFVKITGICRFTDTLRIPSWVVLCGDLPGAITSAYTPTRTTGSVLLADFADENKVAVAATGKWLSDGRWIDPITEVIGGATYDGGKISRRYGVGFRDLVIATEGDVKIGLAITGAPSFAIDNVTVQGFLNGVAAHSSWGVHTKNLNIRAKHVAWMGYNIKAANIHGYFSGMSFGPDTPALDETTAIAGFYAENSLHNPASIRFLTTCLYERYSSANRHSVTLEAMERAIAGFNVHSASYDGAYIEAISTLPIHAVGCNYVFTAPFLYLNTDGVAFVSSNGVTSIINPSAGLSGNRWDWGSQTNYGAVAQLEVQLNSSNSVPINERYSPAVSFTFLRNDPLTIYVSATGDDLNTGLNSNNAVSTLSAAVERAVYYGAAAIKIEDGHSTSGTCNLPSTPLRIYSDNRSTITFGSNQIATVGNNGARVSFEGVDLVKTAVSSSVSARGMFRLLGGASFSFSNCGISLSHDVPYSEGVFITRIDEGANLSVEWLSGTTVTNIARGNNSYNTTQAIVAEVIAPSATIDVGAVWGSHFTVLS